jgi:2-dehydropantoate 2-reductase
MTNEISPKENWHILGSGAIGCLWAFQLVDAGYKVTLLTHHQSAGLTDITVDLNSAQRQVTCYSNIASATSTPTSQTTLLVATKAYATPDALRSIEHILHCYKVIILMQNGMGVVEQVRAQLPGLPLVIGITNQAAYRVKPFHIVRAGIGHTWLGCLPNEPVTSPIESVAALLDISPDYIHWDSDILMRSWIKLGINCVINGLTVTENVRNGELLRPSYQHRIGLLCDEIAQVITQKCRSYTGSELIRQVLQVAKATSGNSSSMRQDALHKRTTEIEYLNGFLVATAKSMQINLPENNRLLGELRQVLGTL